MTETPTEEKYRVLCAHRNESFTRLVPAPEHMYAQAAEFIRNARSEIIKAEDEGRSKTEDGTAVDWLGAAMEAASQAADTILTNRTYRVASAAVRDAWHGIAGDYFFPETDVMTEAEKALYNTIKGTAEQYMKDTRGWAKKAETDTK